MNDSVDERLRIFEQRLNGMESRFSLGLEQSLHQLEELEFRFPMIAAVYLQNLRSSCQTS